LRTRPRRSAPSVEPLSRTEFTELIENFFEYEPLKAGRVSGFRIHLTNLVEGMPVAGADILDPVEACKVSTSSCPARRWKDLLVPPTDGTGDSSSVGFKAT
jgi:hypothetical protein